MAYGFAANRAGKKLNVIFFSILAVAILPAFFIPALTNARYWLLPLLIPTFVLFLLFVTDNLSGKTTILAVALLAANIILPTWALLLNTKQSWKTHQQFKELAEFQKAANS